jgi:hypothetical protein
VALGGFVAKLACHRIRPREFPPDYLLGSALEHFIQFNFANHLQLVL